MEFNSKASAVSRELQQRIRDGFWRPGDKLPTTLQLAAEYQVGKITMSQALNQLVQDGTLIGKRGVGYLVQSRPPGPEERREIGFLFPDLSATSNSFLNLLAASAAETALSMGYRLIVVPCGESLRESLERCGVRNVLLIGEIPAVFEQFLLAGLHREYRYLMMTRSAEISDINYLDEAGAAGLKKLFRQIVEAGHPRFALLGTDSERFSYTRHYTAYRELYRELGTSAPQQLYPIPEDAPQEEYDIAIAKLLQQQPRPTLLMVFRSRFLPKTLLALEKHAIRIPEDLEIITIDNALGADYQCNGLSIANFSLPSKREFAAKAVRLLVSLILYPERAPIHAELDYAWHPGASSHFSPKQQN